MSGESWKEFAIQHKYAELPDEPRYKKKKKKKSIKRSNHKHRYASAILDCGQYQYYQGVKEPRYYVVEYCSICGRINEVILGGNIRNPNLPVFKVEFKDLFAKRINLEDISES